MSGLSSILNDAASGVQTAQTALQVVSNNVSNVNTPGYVQTKANQASLAAGAQGAGVTITDIQRITNQYLEAAKNSATSASSAAAVVDQTFTQAQGLFGDPSASGSLFANLDNVFSAFSTYANGPSTAAGSAALGTVNQFLSQSASIFSSLTTLSSDTDSQISSDVTSVNGLLSQISKLNVTISQGQVAGGDVTGAQNQQSQLINSLTSLMNVKVNPSLTGGVNILAADGTSLVGPSGPAVLGYTASGPTGTFSIQNATGQSRAFNGVITSGEIGGLTQLRNVSLPALSSQLSSLVQGAATTLNAIHNAYTAAPPPSTLSGQPTGLDIATIAGDFTGKTTLAFVNPTTNAIDHTVAIDFTAGSVTVDGGGASAFTPATFLSTLQTAMSGLGGSATYAGGALSLSTGGADGLAIKDDAANPATNGGRGFSAYFGLNNLIGSNTISNFNTGLKSTDASGFPAGQTLTLRISASNGAKIQDVTVTTPATGTVAGLLGALNATSGVGNYGSFSLSNTGALSFIPAQSGQTVSVVTDNTANTAAGASISQLFGIGPSAQSAAAQNLAVPSALRQNPALLATASLNLNAGVGVAAVQPGDTTGADALSQAGLSAMTFPAVAGVPAQSTSLSNYAASIAGAIANTASAASTSKAAAAAAATSASTALASVEGVNIDQEMVNLTTYQQAYNASARMIAAAASMFTTLLNMTNGA